MAEGTLIHTGRGRAISATGGTVTDIVQNGVEYRVHTFTSVGTSTFEILSGNDEAEILIVAGGAAGARFDSNGSGGGGGGGYLEGKKILTSGSYSITVGAGGARSTGSNQPGANGDDSLALGLRALGGGGGGASGSGKDGGSGGGGGNNAAQGFGLQRNSGNVIGFGNDGAASGGGGIGGGGGGAGGAGGLTGTQDFDRANGGVGKSSSITGNLVTYAAGGNALTDGSGNTPSSSGVSGSANTGDGGTNGYLTDSGAGGSGIVIIRYRRS